MELQSAFLSQQGIVLLEKVAEKYCQESRKWSPENPYVYFYLGQSLLEQGKYPEAKVSYRKAHAAGEEYPGQDFRNNPYVPTLLEEQAVVNQKNGKGENADIMLIIAEDLRKQNSE